MISIRRGDSARPAATLQTINIAANNTIALTLVTSFLLFERHLSRALLYFASRSSACSQRSSFLRKHPQLLDVLVAVTATELSCKGFHHQRYRARKGEK